MWPRVTSCKRGAAQRQRIDAVMGIEALVFIGQQQLEIARIDVGLGIDRQPPAAVGHRIGAQQLAVAVDDRGRDLPRLLRAATGRARRPRPRSTAADDQARPARPRCRRRQPDPPPGERRAAVRAGRYGDRHALISPDAPRPHRCRCGRSARDCTCPRHRPAAARICRANRAHHIGHREHRLVVGWRDRWPR